MKKIISACAVATMLALSFPALSTTVRINVLPSSVPDEALPRANLGDAPTGYGANSWQGPAAGVGNKSNWHARYNSDGDYLSALFPTEAATLTINDLAEISYFTKRPSGSVGAGEDWWVYIYTRPTGSGDKASWYHDKFINNYSDHTVFDSWTQYSTSTGMTFSSTGLGTVPAGTLLSGLKSAVGTQLIEMISVQTNSGWNGFDGYLDGLEITLNSGSVGQVNFTAVPEPATLVLLSLGLAGVGFTRRKQCAV